LKQSGWHSKRTGSFSHHFTMRNISKEEDVG